ncbi:MAG: hypothetical protein ACE5I3_00900, partial [Phycisphaerae bacterium]
PAPRGELIAVLRKHAHIWQPRLKSYLRSADPRDRILVLQIINEELARRFRHDLEPLLDDPVDRVRHLARKTVRNLSQQRPLPGVSPIESPRQGVVPDEKAHDRARRELRAALDRFAADATEPADADLIERARDLLRELRIGQYELTRADTLSESEL